jgi:hypothetical protein
MTNLVTPTIAIPLVFAVAILAYGFYLRRGEAVGDLSLQAPALIASGLAGEKK